EPRVIRASVPAALGDQATRLGDSAAGLAAAEPGVTLPLLVPSTVLPTTGRLEPPDWLVNAHCRRYALRAKASSGARNAVCSASGNRSVHGCRRNCVIAPS